MGYMVFNRGKKKNMSRRFYYKTEPTIFGAKNKFSKNVTDFAQIGTKLFYKYPKYTYKISAQ